MRFNDFLKTLIDKSGLTNAELARRIGVHKSYITQLVNNHCNPPSKLRCNQIADALSCKEHERTELFFSALEGRMPVDVLEIFNMYKSKLGENYYPLTTQGKQPALQDEITELNPSLVPQEPLEELLNLIEERKNSPGTEKHPVAKIFEKLLFELKISETVDYSQETIDNRTCDVLRFGNSTITKGRWKPKDSVKHADNLTNNGFHEQHKIIFVINGSLKVNLHNTTGNGNGNDKEHIIHEGGALCFPAHLGYEMLSLTETDILFLCTDPVTKL